MSEDLIWAVSKRITCRKEISPLHAATETAGSEDRTLALAPAANTLESLHEYGLSEGKGKGFLILSPALESWKEKKSRACAASGGGRSCETADE